MGGNLNKVDNAVIMAAGTSSRFAPLSYEIPKALITVKGEVLIERQINQLHKAGINEIYIVTGYKAEMFDYLEEKFGVKLIHNPDFLTRNNNASINVVKNILGNTYICSADNYFSKNPFENEVSDCYYAAVYANGDTKEWCMEYDDNGLITKVTVGGSNAWYMLGHTFWDKKFSEKFKEILEAEYDLPQTTDMLWEDIYINHIDQLEMKIRKYSDDDIYEFDTLDELRAFDNTYIDDTHSVILKSIANQLGCQEKDITDVTVFKDYTNEAAGFTFINANTKYSYSYSNKLLLKI